MIGGNAALYLRSLGYEVTLAGRHPQGHIPVLRGLPFMQGDYIRGEITLSQLKAFDAIVFAAGSDLRYVPQGEDGDHHFQYANGIAIPTFARLARSAGVKHFVQLENFYPHIEPDQVEKPAYVRPRKAVAREITTLAPPGFSSRSIDAPIIVGMVPGMTVSFFSAIVEYAESTLRFPPYAPLGGTNFMSVKSLSQAIADALENGEAISGKSLLVGDENLTVVAFFKLLFDAVGRDIEIPVLAQDHPLLPKNMIYSGENVVSYEPGQEAVRMLGDYERNAIKSAVCEIVAAYRMTP